MLRDVTMLEQGPRLSGHLQVKGAPRSPKYFAHWTDRAGIKRTRTLGPAHVRDSGRRTVRGAMIWRAGNGPCPAGHVTPRDAEDQLAALLEEARWKSPDTPAPMGTPVERVPTFGDAVEQWLTYLRDEKRREASTVQDARNTARAYLLPRFGADTPLYTIEVQKILVLLHGVFKLAKRRKLIQANPSGTPSESRSRTRDVQHPRAIEFEASTAPCRSAGRSTGGGAARTRSTT